MPDVAQRRSAPPRLSSAAVSLRELLAAQPPAAFERLLARRHVELDPRKQLDAHEQAARALASIPRRVVDALGALAADALTLLVPAPGFRPRADLGGGALALVEAGLVFGHPTEPDALVLPAPYRLQLASPRAESRHAARALLAALDDETRDDVIATHHRRRTHVAWPLALEPVLLQLETPALLEQHLGGLDRDGLLALSAIEARGGEVGLDAYLDLCREPARWMGSRVPRRGLAFLLVANALVLPSGDGRLVMPAEVAALVGRERRRVLSARRAEAIERTEAREDEPQRATLASPPGPRAVAAWLDAGGAPRSRSAVARAARRSGTSFDETLLLATLADATPMRNETLASYGRALLATWRAGHAWDELLAAPRPEGDDPLETPTVILRACVIDALASLPRGRFAERDAVRAAVASDLRFDGVRSAFERGRARHAAAWVPTLEEGVDRMLLTSLPALGLVDVGKEGSLRLSTLGAELAASALAAPGEEAPGEEAPGEETQRTSPQAVPRGESATTWHTEDRARLASSQRLLHLAPLAGCADAVADGDGLALTLDPDRVPLDGRERVLAAIERLGCPDVAAFAARCPRPRGSARAHRSALVVALDDAALAAELRGAATLARWLVAPHPEGPVLVFSEDAPRTALVRALERLGVSVELTGASRGKPAAKPRRGASRIR
jgi:hypothetical protein